VTRFEEGLMSAVRANHTDILDAIREQQAISDETDAKLKTAIETYANSFVAS
jgi:F-type H+-transporting ATPase subunit alpha